MRKCREVLFELNDSTAWCGLLPTQGNATGACAAENTMLLRTMLRCDQGCSLRSSERCPRFHHPPRSIPASSAMRTSARNNRLLFKSEGVLQAMLASASAVETSHR